MVTVGQIQGGYQANTIASDVEFRGTLRNFSGPNRLLAKAWLAKTIQQTAKGLGGTAEVAYIEEIPSVVNDKVLVKNLRGVLEGDLGASNIKIMKPLPYADDFSFMAQKVSSFYFQIGVKNSGRGAVAQTHSELFDIDERALTIGARLLAKLAKATLNIFT